MRCRLALAVIALASLPHAVNASCDSGATPSYGDVAYVRIAIYSLVGLTHPWFTYEATIGSTADRSTAALYARRATAFNGRFEAVDPEASFHAVLDVLRRKAFFDMRLHQASAFHPDGPEDEIVVARCGVETVLTTLPFGHEWEVDDDQGRKLFQLERDLQTAIFKQQWRLPEGGTAPLEPAPP